MNNTAKCGTLITLEGIDGCGKSSAAQSLYDDLKETYPVVLTREPGATKLGEVLRDFLQNRTCTVHAKAEFLLFAADRVQHFQEIVLPALAAGKIVISDRMADSSFAYQGYGRGVDPAMIKIINQWAMEAREPDATVYFEISFEDAKKRLGGRNEIATVFEQEQREFFERVAHGFEESFKNRSGILRVNGSLTPAEVRQEVKKVVLDFIHKSEATDAFTTSVPMDRA